MSSRAIINFAYNYDLVPSHVYGKTQHKTLGARLSEEILLKGDDAEFYRTEPGKFFLRKFLYDSKILDEHKTVFRAKRRKRELKTKYALSISKDIYLSFSKSQSSNIKKTKTFDELKALDFKFSDPRNLEDNKIIVKSFTLVRKLNKILSYRVGNYREDYEGFKNKRTLGFSSYIDLEQNTLFDCDDYGIANSGLNAVYLDLDFPVLYVKNLDDLVDLKGFLEVENINNQKVLVGLVVFNCPEWFEPTKKKLAINDLGWFDPATKVNNIEDFDYISQKILETEYLKNI